MSMVFCYDILTSERSSVLKLKIEAERKFWVRVLPRRYLENGGNEITQWYIWFYPPVRIRVENFDNCFLTIKIGKKTGEDYELETGIPKFISKILAKFRRHNKVRKTRYSVGNLELDVFVAQLKDLVLIDFEKKTGKEVLEIPSDLEVEEVTGDSRFRNHNLAKMDEIPEEWKCKII